MTASDTPEREQRASNDVRMREEAERVYDAALQSEAAANGASSEGFARRTAINAMLTFRNQNYPFADTELSRTDAWLDSEVAAEFAASDRRAQRDGE